jgi:hypothetical protein
VEYGGQAADDIRRIWQNLESRSANLDIPAILQALQQDLGQMGSKEKMSPASTFSSAVLNEDVRP